MSHPYQITRICKGDRFAGAGLLLAACGPNIVSINLHDGSILSQWPEGSDGSAVNEENTSKDEGPPGKKRKLEATSQALPNVIKMAISPDNCFAVAVTGDDKCIRVFEIQDNGKLTELNQRCMPKRPCAVLVTSDNSTILCGDKFGDVYSLPLLPEETAEEKAENEVAEPEESADTKEYVPTATNLTVHTAKNRRALENQMKQKGLKAKTKEPLKFEHKLLLGHVSMLTDVLFASPEGEAERHHIITADRDEHIRISRGPPQAWVIERYCLGHKEFISKLCLLPKSNLLVSGGGDDWLGIWDWTTGELKRKFDIKAALHELPENVRPSVFGDDGHVAVSGLWAMQGATHSGQDVILLFVACEKIPALITLNVGENIFGVTELSGNPLDLAIHGANVIVSVDSETSSQRLQGYAVDANQTQKLVALVADHGLNETLKRANGLEMSATRSEDTLYGYENLRKRGTLEDAEDAA